MNLYIKKIFLQRRTQDLSIVKEKQLLRISKRLPPSLWLLRSEHFFVIVFQVIVSWSCADFSMWICVHVSVCVHTCERKLTYARVLKSKISIGCFPMSPSTLRFESDTLAVPRPHHLDWLDRKSCDFSVCSLLKLRIVDLHPDCWGHELTYLCIRTASTLSSGLPFNPNFTSCDPYHAIFFKTSKFIKQGKTTYC